MPANSNLVSDFQIPRPQQSIGFQFWKLHAHWQKRVAEALAPHEITHTQFVILASIKWFEEQGREPSQAQITQLTGIEKMTLSKAIRQLESTSLVVRIKSEVDTRAVAVSLTTSGKETMPQAIRAVENVDAALFGVMTKSEELMFNKLLQKVNPNI